MTDRPGLYGHVKLSLTDAFRSPGVASNKFIKKPLNQPQFERIFQGKIPKISALVNPLLAIFAQF